MSVSSFEHFFEQMTDAKKAFTMVERFFSAKQQLATLEAFPSITLLSGPPCCGKTSLLFQFAINCATEGDHVVFICSKRRLEHKPPFLSQGVDPSSDVLDRIQMKYIEDHEGIRKYLAAFHLYTSFPAVIIIDDFGDFFSDMNCQHKYGNARGRDLAMIRTLALCEDAISHANMKLQSQSYCKFLLADTHQGESPRLLFIYKRWVQCILTIQGDGNSSFMLKNSSISGNRFDGMRTAKYSIALQYLLLEDVF